MWLVAACLWRGAPPPSQALTSPPPPETPATLGVDDVFEVHVFGEAELSGTYRVGPEGTIDYPLVGRITALGKLPGQIADDIKKGLAEKYIRDPQVSVFVKESNSRKVSVLGQVQKPGTFPYFDRMTVIEAISSAGGFTALAAKNETVVTRRGERFTVPVEWITTGKAPVFYLQPGDTVMVPERIF